MVVCKFSVACPFYVNRCPHWMYYVIHKLQLLLRVAIHLNTHEHLGIKGMCKDVLEEIKVLVKGQVSRTPKGKISTIVLNANRAFWHIICSMRMGKGLWKFFKGRNLTR